MRDRNRFLVFVKKLFRISPESLEYADVLTDFRIYYRAAND
ncbi:hypothetical protein SAMN02745781_03715 [Vibrio gazogenes DSM 21264]|uniref:Uncharacterized protein n=1 Tax=Vibrio gazogenes DSM 21264 = NBRC 103151 TaxID=1123492 RepID=A0A1M5G7C7_VIBGA|nr:hypothetical protein SAMN02745781_03715 [Vibrio gazogenes DSM 21264] [Vibrio gazogenes DSM 21264 = NBRC 103151]SJN59503.1 hypothetical protein BQ6471_03497 [Vibrio gazogenes]